MASWLTIVLPGRNYGPLGGTLRMPCLVLESLGAQTVVVEYPVGANATNREVVSTSSVQITDFVSGANPDRITFVAKSLGTLVLSARNWSLYGTVQIEAIWLTPLFGDVSVRDGAIRRGWRSLLVAGDADPNHDPVGFEKVRARLGAESLVVARADHGLEIPSDPDATLEALVNLTHAVHTFTKT